MTLGVGPKQKERGEGSSRKYGGCSEGVGPDLTWDVLVGITPTTHAGFGTWGCKLPLVRPSICPAHLQSVSWPAGPCWTAGPGQEGSTHLWVLREVGSKGRPGNQETWAPRLALELLVMWPQTITSQAPVIHMPTKGTG